jgi:cyanophycin synthetase
VIFDPTDPPFEDSRRLTGPNLYFDGTGAVLETMIGAVVDEALIDAWQARIGRARHVLGWTDQRVIVRRHATGVTLAFTAPLDQLYAATDVNEWAWLASLREMPDAPRFAVFHSPGHASLIDESDAMCTLTALAAAERRPKVQPLIDAAQAHRLPLLLDDDALSIGEGDGSRTWPIDDLPGSDGVPWSQLHRIPIALVTGSNGKTTTVRLLAAMARAHGWHTAHSCTDGLYLDGELLEGGDYSGPSGARTLLRHPDTEAAILETARGGLLRRGLAVRHANVAVVTNVSPDHFGEYGIHDLSDLAQVKLTVARAIDADGTLVLNADDDQLRRHAEPLSVPIAWFALDDALPFLIHHRSHGGRTAGLRNGRLSLFDGSQANDLGEAAAMPITIEGSASYNIANIAAASLAALALGIAPAAIASVLARFGRDHHDNAGRLQRWSLAGGIDVYVDYAHNPDGLHQLLGVATRQRREARLALVLGQAGNREDDAIRDLAATAAHFRPDFVALKDIDGFMRGREAGEVAGILREALIAGGVPAPAIETHLDEVDAARTTLAQAQPGDILVLPIHATQARARVTALLDRLLAEAWVAGMELPTEPVDPDDASPT